MAVKRGHSLVPAVFLCLFLRSSYLGYRVWQPAAGVVKSCSRRPLRLTEIWFLSQYQHPNIVQYYGSEITEDRFYIYLEYVHPGSINKYVRQHYGAMTESVVRNFTHHILSGLAYLHSKKIMHRDIKGANLLVDAKGVVTLADFGMAKSLSEAAPNLWRKGVYWMAPEVLQATFVKDSEGYDLAVDIWSLGCTLIEMFMGKPPWSGFEGPAAMFKVLHKTPPIPDSLSSERRDFLQRCFRRNLSERPTAAVLLEHPFIRNAGYYNNAHGAMKISDPIGPTKVSFTGLHRIQPLCLAPRLVRVRRRKFQRMIQIALSPPC